MARLLPSASLTFSHLQVKTKGGLPMHPGESWLGIPGLVGVCVQSTRRMSCSVLASCRILWRRHVKIQGLTELNHCNPIFLKENQFISVTQSCSALRDPIDSTPGLPAHHQLPEFTQTHVHWVGDDIQPSSPTVIPFSSHLQSFPALGAFPMSHFFASGGQSIGASASVSVLPMNIQDWFPLGWTGYISLQSKGCSTVFSNTTAQNINSSVFSFLYSPTLKFIHDYWKNHSFD